MLQHTREKVAKLLRFALALGASAQVLALSADTLIMQGDAEGDCLPKGLDSYLLSMFVWC